MKILAITTKSPYPLYEGRALRTYNLLRHIARRHEVHLLSFVQTPEEIDGIAHMRSVCAHVESERLYMDNARTRLALDLLREPFSRAPLMAVKYRSSRMRARIEALMRAHRYDVVHLDMLHLAEYIDLFPHTPVVLVEHNVESVILQRRLETETSMLKRLYIGYQHRKLRHYEARMCRRADHVVAVSELDAEQLRAMSGSANVTSISNGVDTEFFRATGEARVPTDLVFVGGLTWFPNLDAIRHFRADVLPHIVAAVPDVRITVVGKNPDDRAVREIADDPRITLAGLVDDIRPVISRAAVYVVPLRIGGGTRLKILDALSMGKALVSTSVGCEGLDVVDGEHLVVADTPEQFAAAVVRLLRDPAAAQALGAAGRALVQRKYEWAALADRLDAVYRASLTPDAVARPVPA